MTRIEFLTEELENAGFRIDHENDTVNLARVSLGGIIDNFNYLLSLQRDFGFRIEIGSSELNYKIYSDVAALRLNNDALLEW